MVTIISGTNRAGSYTKKVATEYQRFLRETETESVLLALDEHDVYMRSAEFIRLETDILKQAERFIFILPEYNGSYPGLVKLMIDNTEVSKVWWHKKALLTGVSSGRAGNLRGMEHITGSLLHMKMLVHPNRLPISTVQNTMNEAGTFTEAGVISSVKTQLEEFLSF